MARILGLDLGTNSMGIAVRNTDKDENNVFNQLEYFSTVIFPSGVGEKKGSEFSYAAERTTHRSQRKVYRSRKQRIWATLKVLIENGYCPLSPEGLKQWCTYDKALGYFRKYPNEEAFEQWVRLDFDGDGVADYSSPYQLRAELMNRKFDFTNPLDRMKLGRAIYHIAQRRGFKSSKGETMQEQERNETAETNEMFTGSEMKKSEEKKSKGLVEYMLEHNLPTVGCAFAQMEKDGERIRNNEGYQAVRSQYREELQEIFKFQGFDVQNDSFCKRILSDKKSEGTIFYKKPLKSQKGLVGKCTLEPKKSRCPVGHPEFEKYRALCLLNNIKYRTEIDAPLTPLKPQMIIDVYQNVFLKAVRASFKMEEIAKYLKEKYYSEGINYKDNVSVSGCPVTVRLMRLLGEDWQKFSFERERINKSTGEVYKVNYEWSDIWHICFSYDDVEYVQEIAEEIFADNDKAVKQMIMLFDKMPQGYGTLSLKAIKKINRFLEKGIKYSDSVILAKLPDIFGDKWNVEENNVLKIIEEVATNNRKNKSIYNVVNALIADYKSLPDDEKYAFHNTSYIIDELDRKAAEARIRSGLGDATWQSMSTAEQDAFRDAVLDEYQAFFASSKRDYKQLPRLSDAIIDRLKKEYPEISSDRRLEIYHPSMIEVYPKSADQRLGSPVIGAIRNPMAMRVLHTLRKQVNALLDRGLIDEDTHVVVETARELNDANMRAAIRDYQKLREDENNTLRKVIEEFYPNFKDVSEADIRKCRALVEQTDNFSELKRRGKQDKDYRLQYEIAKYKIWLEQGGRCIYTDKVITIKELFEENVVDIEHTVPRSISFDNSMSNITVCDSDFNRKEKRNLLPSQLKEEYQETIRKNIQGWKNRIEDIKDCIDYWKSKAKRATTKDRKDEAIRNQHLWRFELDYWQKKVAAFELKEYTDTYRNNQLNDTRIITKYAYHFLKSVFSSVSTQRGEMTSDYRKMLGMQSVDEKKNRDFHSHHAIDAAVLTLIPKSSARDRMLRLFYEIQEAELLGLDTTYKKTLCLPKFSDAGLRWCRFS